MNRATAFRFSLFAFRFSLFASRFLPFAVCRLPFAVCRLPFAVSLFRLSDLLRLSIARGRTPTFPASAGSHAHLLTAQSSHSRSFQHQAAISQLRLAMRLSAEIILSKDRLLLVAFAYGRSIRPNPLRPQVRRLGRKCRTCVIVYHVRDPT